MEIPKVQHLIAYLEDGLFEQTNIFNECSFLSMCEELYGVYNISMAYDLIDEFNKEQAGKKEDV